MARRIKEAASVHRQRIGKAAGSLFEKKGIEIVSMDMIAKESGYSKATLYVYFKSKDEIISYLTLKSMKYLKEFILEGLRSASEMKDRYLGICNGLYKYATTYPLYFKMVQSPINIDFNNSRFEENEREIFYIGEEINEIIGRFIIEGIKSNIFKEDLKSIPTIFCLWGMLCGVIELAINKEEYIKQEMNMSLVDFLDNGFLQIYNSIKK